MTTIDHPAAPAPLSVHDKINHLTTRTAKNQSQLADYCKIGQTAVAEWKRTDNIPKRHIRPVADFFGLPPDILELRDRCAFESAVARAFETGRAD